MHYYIHEKTREIYAYETAIDRRELVPITEAEVDEILNPPPTPEQLTEKQQDVQR
ncbi:hypothetical protein BDD26_2437 [Xenorhabdus cabanillasii]|uniref:Uncharacterized protein n=1 Tax=Xenorhabdus cabanillasii TaxID=351673 RepID=A0A3D9UDQ4_9GAMM|nr:hypothetical protein BDD26_2437 [Xenorhabdus cabanillasii]